MIGPKWTHGKWVAYGCELVADSTVIATLHWHTGRDVQNKADATLIQSAPDLYAALDNLLNCVDGNHDQGWLDRVRNEASAALARARGETT